MQFGHMAADGLDSENDVVRFTSRHSDETTSLLGLDTQCSAAGSEWELADYDLLTSLLRLVRCEPH